MFRRGTLSLLRSLVQIVTPSRWNVIIWWNLIPFCKACQCEERRKHMNMLQEKLRPRLTHSTSFKGALQWSGLCHCYIMNIKVLEFLKIYQSFLILYFPRRTSTIKWKFKRRRWKNSNLFILWSFYFSFCWYHRIGYFPHDLNKQSKLFWSPNSNESRSYSWGPIRWIWAISCQKSVNIRLCIFNFPPLSNSVGAGFKGVGV